MLVAGLSCKVLSTNSVLSFMINIFNELLLENGLHNVNYLVECPHVQFGWFHSPVGILHSNQAFDVIITCFKL